MVDGLTKSEFDLLCEKPPSYAALELEIKLLKSELKQKDEKLSELTHGIPIEKAKTDGTVYNYYIADEKHWEHVTWADSIGWHYWDYYSDCTVIVHPERLYPLPSQNSQTQEGSDVR